MRLAVTLALLGLAAAQDTPPVLPPGQAPTFGHYGPPQPVEVSEIMFGSYQRRPVIVRGEIMPLDLQGQYYQFHDRTGTVVLMTVGELGGAMHDLIGREVRIVGLVRELVTKQDTCPGPNMRPVPESYCLDPELPITPDLVGDRAGWPKWSITAWSISDNGPLTGRKRDVERSALADVLSGETLPDKDVKVVGRFCGARLCGTIGPAPEASAWVVEEEGTAVWVVGKEPKGKGWRLDPAYKGDTTRWVEVIGRLQACGAGSRCLRARTVTLVARPATPAP
jgi:hypothetical protein